jgi:hypothetical protein
MQTFYFEASEFAPAAQLHVLFFNSVPFIVASSTQLQHTESLHLPVHTVTATALSYKRHNLYYYYYYYYYYF